MKIALLLFLWLTNAVGSSLSVLSGSPPAAVTGAAFRSMSSIGYGSRTNTVVTAPSGIVNGDILILAVLIAGPSPETRPTPTMPSGFTVIQGPAEVTDASDFGVKRVLAWKLASSESGSYTVTHAAASSQAVMVCISGASSSTPVSSDNSGTGTTTTALGVTTPSNNSLVLFFAQAWENYGISLRRPRDRPRPLPSNTTLRGSSMSPAANWPPPGPPATKPRPTPTWSAEAPGPGARGW